MTEIIVPLSCSLLFKRANNKMTSLDYILLGVLTPRKVGDGMHRPGRDTTNKTYQKVALAIAISLY